MPTGVPHARLDFPGNLCLVTQLPVLVNLLIHHEVHPTDSLNVLYHKARPYDRFAIVVPLLSIAVRGTQNPVTSMEPDEHPTNAEDSSTPVDNIWQEDSLVQYFPGLSGCDICEGFPPTRWQADRRLLLSDMQRGCQQGCGVCTLITRGLETLASRMNAVDLENFAALEVVEQGFVDDDGYGFIVSSTTKQPKSSLRLRLLDAPPSLPAKGDMARSIPHALENCDTHVPTHLDIARVVALTQLWRDNCVRNHPDCKIPPQPVLPKRVLDLSSLRHDGIKLFESTGQTAPYAALSYCWGSTEATWKTTISTLADRKSGVAWTSLPRCFKDSIELCWALGIHYLWIDSICIIQNSDEDWKVESGKMADIYSNAALTISASLCAEPGTSLLSDRWSCYNDENGTRQPRIPSDYVRIAHEERTFWLGPAERPSHDIMINHHFVSENDYAPLNARAWAFQERMLAPQTLHFHASELVWECRSSMDCECGMLTEATQPHTKRDLNVLDKPDTDIFELFEAWKHVVTRYSPLGLTYERDRLVALAGLAARFAKHDLGLYIAGMWTGTLPHALLWRTDHGPDDKPRFRMCDVTFHAPSWSWASFPLTGRLIPCYHYSPARLHKPQDTDVELNGVHYSPPTPNAYGGVEFAMLGLRGRCIDGYLAMREWIGVMKDRESRERKLNAIVTLDFNKDLDDGMEVVYLHILSQEGLLLQKSPLTTTKHHLLYHRLGTVRLLDHEHDRLHEHSSVRDIHLV